ncbi:MAG: NFACT RNA binding domain-containing protein [Nanoarchaeota archaeon]
MDVEVWLNKSVDESASFYFEKAKKARKKIEGIEKAISESEAKLQEQEEKIFAKEQKDEEKTKQKSKPRKTEWYEKFHWFFTSEGKLVIGGRDATTNEAVIKKHTEPNDLVFHTDMSGSPFMVIKSEGKPIMDIEKEETAEFLACYSRAWKAGISSIEVLYVNPDQVTKEAKAGEYLSKGSFMIKGKTNYINAVLRLCIAVVDDVVYAGPQTAIRTMLSRKFPAAEKKDIDRMYVKVLQGTAKASQIAKEIKKALGSGHVDDIIRVLPTGGCRLGK